MSFDLISQKLDTKQLHHTIIRHILGPIVWCIFFYCSDVEEEVIHLILLYCLLKGATTQTRLQST